MYKAINSSEKKNSVQMSSSTLPFFQVVAGVQNIEKDNVQDEKDFDNGK